MVPRVAGLAALPTPLTLPARRRWGRASLGLGPRWIARRWPRRRARILPQPRLERRDLLPHRQRRLGQQLLGWTRQRTHATSLQNHPLTDHPGGLDAYAKTTRLFAGSRQA